MQIVHFQKRGAISLDSQLGNYQRRLDYQEFQRQDRFDTFQIEFKGVPSSTCGKGALVSCLHLRNMCMPFPSLRDVVERGCFRLKVLHASHSELFVDLSCMPPCLLP